MPKIDLRPDHLLLVQSLLRQHLPNSITVWAFGSRTNWTAKEYSDLDLALESQQRISRDILLNLDIAFEESDLPWKVDFIELSTVTPGFKNAIDNNKVLLPLDAGKTRNDGQPVKENRRGLGMSVEWPTKPLGELLKLVIDHRGKTPKKIGFEDFHPSGYPVLSAKHVKTDRLVNLESIRFANEEMYNKWMKNETQEGDIILTSEAPLGQVYYLDGKTKYLLGQRVFGLRPNKEKINPLYLVAWLSSLKGQSLLEGRATGSTVLGIKQVELLKIEVDVPPPEVQEQIACIRYKLVEKIELNTQTNQTLESIAQAIFKSWFVDFEPVKAKIKARKQWLQSNPSPNQAQPDSMPPQGGGDLEEAMNLAAMCIIASKSEDELAELKQHNPATYQHLAQTAALFPSAMQESELGEIPEGWEVKNLPDVIDFLEGPGIRNWQYSNNEDGIKFINIRCIKNGDLSLATANKLTKEEAFGKYAHFQLEEDDIVVSTSGTLGRYAFVRAEHLPLSLNTSVIRFKKIKGVSTLHFIAGYIDTDMQRQIEMRASGSAQLNFGPMHLKQIDMIVPPYSLLDRHTQCIEPMFRRCQLNLKEIDALSTLRDTLLPKLLSGEISPHPGLLPEGDNLGKGTKEL